MSFAPIPRATMRGYWKLEDHLDSSGNARNLSYQGSVSVPHNNAKFALGANFGTSGTDKALAITAANPMSATTIPDMTFSFWLKLNNTTSTNSPQGNITGLNTDIAATTGCRTNLHYTISGGNVSFIVVTTLTTSNATFTYTIAADTLWRHFVLVKSSTTTITMYVNGVQVGTHTGSGSDASIILASSSFFVIGNARNPPPRVQQMWCTIDEFILEERAWSASEVRKIYTQYKGFMAA